MKKNNNFMNFISLGHRVLSIVCLTAIFVACSGSDDGDGGGGTGSGNNNRNNYVSDYTITENIKANVPSKDISKDATTLAKEAAQRIEIPALKGGDNYFLVYRSSEIGINFCVEWDCYKRSQRWTAYQITSTTNKKAVSRSDEPFQPDPYLPEMYRTELSDYRGSGYQRGHICPSADRLSSNNANEQTFYLSNIQPQLGLLNTKTWMYMESQVRKWSPANGSTDTMYVCKGGTIDNNNYTTIGRLTVPKYFYMAVLIKNAKSGNGGYKAMAFWIEHLDADQGSDLSKFAMSVDALEAKTGIDFFCNLPDDIENTVESNYVPSVWGLK